MRVSNGRDLSRVYNANFPKDIINPNINCHEVFQLKSMVSGQFVNSTEPIIVKLLSDYLSLNEFGKREEICLYWEPKYIGVAGNKQEIDISIELNGDINFGISIKSQFGGGKLTEADLNLRLIQEHKELINNFQDGGSVSDVLQDMARIQNIKDNHGEFKSITILYSQPSKKKWTEKITSQYSHSYIFLNENNKTFFEEIEIRLPGIRILKVNSEEYCGSINVMQ